VACTQRREDRIETVLLPLDEVLELDEDGHVIPRKVDERFYDLQEMNATPEGMEYFKPILGPKPMPYRYPELRIQTA